jgi:prepilin-type N-terminal cleavage/methylation domain-containing protein
MRCADTGATRLRHTRAAAVRGEHGMTIVELLIVVAMVGVLASLVSLNVNTITSRARGQAAAANLRLVRDGLLRVGVDCGGLPVWSAAAGDPGLTVRPSSWGATCWRGPYLNNWPSAPGSYEFDAPGGTTVAVVRVHSVPTDSFQAVAAQIVGVFGPSATIRFASATGWSAEIPVSGEYQVAAAAATTPGSSTPATPSSTPVTPTAPVANPGSIATSAFRSVGGAWALVGDRLQGSGTSSKAIADVTGADYTYSVDLQTLKKGKATADIGRILFHYQDEKNYYAVVPKSDGTIGIDKMQNGKLTQNLAVAKKTGIDPLQSHNYQVKIVGNTYTVAVDGKQLISYKDTKPISTGGVGVANNKSTSAFGNAIVLKAGAWS